MEELFDVYTRDGEYIGVKSKSICHSDNPDFKNLIYYDEFVPFNDDYKKFVLDLFDNTFKLK